MHIPPDAAPPRPQPAVLAVVVRDDRVLLVQRKNPPHAEKWGFPGGKVEWGETMAEAAVRELLEETGVTGQSVDVLTALDAVDRDEAGAVHFHYVLVALLLRWRGGDGEAADDAQALAWLTPEEIDVMSETVSENVSRLAHFAVACMNAGV